MRLIAALSLGLVLLAPATARAQDPLSDEAATTEWVAKLADRRRVVDRVVVCFDRTSVLTEIAKWDAERFWPVLLWDSDLVPKFIAAFEPKEVLLAAYARTDEPTLAAGLDAVAAAWGEDPKTIAGAPAKFLEALRARKRAPMGVVLLSENSPELLGGIALAAGRHHLPLPFPTPETHATRVTSERTEEIRRDLAKRLADLDVAHAKRFDDLDFVTVASDAPFAYTPSDPDAHPGAYTVDDAIARNDDLTRWGWVGRLVGGPARSVYMAMGALFLQPGSGLCFSRYDPKNAVFGAYDPAPALETFNKFFPTEAIRHPDATLARWREVQWPEGNRAGFVLVNSSGGATSWSTSKGGATHFDVPDTVPCVVHYTHSGSAGRPFDVDSIAGRWMANGAYVYFGSHAEPYLQSFVPASLLAARVKAGVPLGAAMRHLYSPAMVGQRQMKVGDADRMVRFNMSGPWKLAFFGDPSYRLTAYRGPREAPESVSSRGYHASIRKFKAARRTSPGDRANHLLASIGIVRLDPSGKDPVDVRTWSRVLKVLPAESTGEALTEMTRAWVASLRELPAADLYAAGKVKSLARVPSTIETLAKDGAPAADASRHFSEFAKGYVAGLARHPESEVAKAPKLATWVLATACGLTPAKSVRKPFYDWIKEAAKGLGLEAKDVLAAVEKLGWASGEALSAATDGLK